MKESRSWRLKWTQKNCVHIAHFFSQRHLSLSLARSLALVSFENRNNRVLSCSVHTSKCQTMKTKSLPTILSFYLALFPSSASLWVLSLPIVCAHCTHTNRHTHTFTVLPQAYETYYILKYNAGARVMYVARARIALVHTLLHIASHKLYKHAQQTKNYFRMDTQWTPRWTRTRTEPNSTDSCWLNAV